MKKKLIIGFVVVILLISILPFPQHIERIYYGENTENGEKVAIDLDMEYLRFLFLNDKIYGTIRVKTERESFMYDDLVYLGRHSIYQAKDISHFFSGWYTNHTMYMKEYENGDVSKGIVGSEPLYVHISSDFDKILIVHNANGVIETQKDSRYVGCVEDTQLENTKEYFMGFYD